MRRALFVAPLLALLLASPRPYRVRFMFRGKADPAYPQLERAVTRGMFADSLIAQSIATPAFDSSSFRDPNRPSVVIVEVTMVPQVDSVTLNVRLLNLLGQPLSHDSVYVARAKIDSAGTEVGRRFAHVLSRH